jgi:hypothetical protein
MKIYVKTDGPVPEFSAQYITPGKVYEVEDERAVFEEWAECFGLDLGHMDFAWLVWQAATQAMERAWEMEKIA